MNLELIVVKLNKEGKAITDSLAIAEFFGKRHDNVIRDIKNLECSKGFRRLNFEESYYLNNQNKKQPMVEITKMGMARLIFKFTGPDVAPYQEAYIHQFDAMEKELFEKQKPVLPSYSEALRQLADSLDKQEELKQQNNLLGHNLIKTLPATEFYKAVTGSKTAINMAEVAKVLNFPKLGRNKMFKFLREQNILQNDNIPYQQYVDKGLFRVIEQKYSLPNGDVQVSFKTLVFQKGLNFIRKLVIKYFL